MKTPYKVLILVLHLFSLFLLTLICFHLEILYLPKEISFYPLLVSFFNNDYVINILCTIITALALYILQIQYSKYKIRNDFRCNEVIQDVYTGIEEATVLKNKSVGLSKKYDNISHEDFNIKRKLRAQIYIDFYCENKASFHLCNLSLTYSNNDLLIESVQSAFFINLNFKLLSILNHIKNRKPNLLETYPKIEQLFNEYESAPTDTTIIALGESIRSFLTDADFLASYWFSLLKYLKYDPIPGKLYIAAFKKMYPEDDTLLGYLKLPDSEQKRISRKVSRQVWFEYFRYRIKHFFD